MKGPVSKLAAAGVLMLAVAYGPRTVSAVEDCQGSPAPGDPSFCYFNLCHWEEHMPGPNPDSLFAVAVDDCGGQCPVFQDPPECVTDSNGCYNGHVNAIPIGCTGWMEGNCGLSQLPLGHDMCKGWNPF